MNIKKLLPVTAVSALILFALAPTAAHAASTSEMQDKVDAITSEFGGEQTAWNIISWPDGTELELVDEAPPSKINQRAAAAASDCASGRYCAYAKINYTGNKLSFTTCPGTQTSLSALGGAVRSISSNVTSRTVRAYRDATVVATITNGTGVTSVSGVTKITCG